MPLDPKVAVVLKYRPELQALFEKINSELPEEYLEKLYSQLQANPKVSADELKQLIYSQYDLELSPFDNDKANEIYRRLKKTKDPRAEEFKDAFELLGDTLDLNQFESYKQQESKEFSVESFSATDEIVDTTELGPINKAELFDIYSVTNTNDLMTTLGITYEDGRGYFYKNNLFTDLDEAIRVAYNNNRMIDNTTPNETQPNITNINGWEVSPTPWRRYGARIIDLLSNGLIGGILLGAIFYALAPASAERFYANLNPALDMIITAFTGCLITGCIIGFSGLSVGKWIFGIKVTKTNGKPIGVVNGIKRDLGVYVKGLALGIPLFSLITMIIAYTNLNKEGTTSWDKNGGYVVSHRPNNGKQYLLNAIGIALIIFLIGFTRLLAHMSY